MTAASIVTYHTPLDELSRCISTLMSSAEICRIDIVDNSRDQAIEHLASEFHTKDKRVAYIPNDNTGYGAGNNISIRKSIEDPTVKYHLVMNSDILFKPETINALKDIMNRDRSIGLTIPMVTDRNGTEQSSYHPLPQVSDLICHRFIPRRLCRKKMARYEIKVNGMTDPLNVPYVHGCFMFMRVDALKEVGLFDERFFMYPEDIDLTRRLHERYQTLVIPTLSIVHDHRAESRKSFKMLRIHAWNMIKYFNKWGWIQKTDRRN